MANIEIRFQITDGEENQVFDTYRFSCLDKAQEKFLELKEIIQEQARDMGMEIVADEPSYFAAAKPGDPDALARVALVV